MAFTRNFVFTDPVAAQQAVQYAQLANQEQAQADQAFNDRIRTGTQGRISQQNAQQQMLLSQGQMAQRASEAEKDRELARQGYSSAQTVAGITAGQRDNVLRAREAADASANKAFALDNFNRGSSFAEMLNNANTPLSLKQKLMQSGDVVMGTDGLWRSRHTNPNTVESIGDIQSRFQPVQGIPGSMGVGGRLPAAMDTMPSRARLLQMGPPPMTTPVEPSPFEAPGFRVFRQSDFISQPPPVFDSAGNEVFP